MLAEVLDYGGGWRPQAFQVGKPRSGGRWSSRDCAPP